MNFSAGLRTVLPSSSARPGRGIVSVVFLALLYTLLNAVKPLHVDDGAYYEFARHLAAHPLDPYGFQIFWYQYPEPANYVLAPPVLPYWWAAAYAVVGEHPFWWKVWLFPFALLFVGSVHVLFRRCARGLEGPLVWMTVLSPTFLPSLNLMLDVPALALSLGAVVLFLRACDTRAVRPALLAGLLTGLAVETKYTGFLAPVVMLLYVLTVAERHPPAASTRLARSASEGSSSLFPRLRFGLTAWTLRVGVSFGLWLMTVILAAAIVISWEWWMARLYADQGGSHFLYHYQENQQAYGTLWDKLTSSQEVLLPLVALLGGLASPAILLGLAALRRRGAVLLGTGLIGLLGLALIICAEGSLHLTLDQELFHLPEPFAFSWSLEQTIFNLFGAILILVTLAVAGRLLRFPRGGFWRPRRWRRQRLDWFLVLWLGLEVAGYVVLTPFPAVRRVLGVVVVGTLVLGRLAFRTCRDRRRRSYVWAMVILSILLGLGFYALDLEEAWARKEAAVRAAEFIRQEDPEAVIWFTGHWGFQYYAEHAGMQAIVPESSQVHQGDWLVLPSNNTAQQYIHLQAGEAVLVRKLPVPETWVLPVETGWGYYGTSIGVPLSHHEGPSVWVSIYRATADFIPQDQDPAS